MIIEIILFIFHAIAAFVAVFFIFIIVPFGVQLFWTVLNDFDRQYVIRHGLIDPPDKIKIMVKNTTLVFDKKRMRRLQKAYDQARAEKEDIFTFEGHEFVTEYAKIMLGYLKTRFTKAG